MTSQNDRQHIIKTQWKDFATVQRWKKQLTIRSHDGELSESTWGSVEYWMPQFLACFDFQTNPDEFIEEAISDPENGEERLSIFFRYLKERGLDANSAIIGAYGVIRGFYSRNKVHTQGWLSPKPLPRMVEKTDANHPLFITNHKTKQLELNRELLRNFLRHLNTRDELVAICLLSTGLDDGDLLKLNVGFVRNQDPNHDRLFLINFRDKNNETLKVFFSKEATRLLRKYVKTERADALDSEPLFVTTMRERKIQFRIQYGREFTDADYSLLPKGTKLTTNQLAIDFRTGQKNMGLKLEKNKQSPLRPKRLRKAFRTACQVAGVGDDMTRLFMGQVSQSSKIYLSKSREELDIFYEKIESLITVYSDYENNDELTSLKQQYEEEKQEMKEHLKIFVFELRKMQKNIEIINAVLPLKLKESHS